MKAKRDRFALAPRLPLFGVPRKVPKGRFIWHNHVQRSVGMSHGLNGFRCLPVDYRKFERCRCGWIDLPHYKIRGLGVAECVSPYQILRNSGFTAKQATATLKSATVSSY
jgi:hypothetical protein